MNERFAGKPGDDRTIDSMGEGGNQQDESPPFKSRRRSGNRNAGTLRLERW